MLYVWEHQLFKSKELIMYPIFYFVHDCLNIILFTCLHRYARKI